MRLLSNCVAGFLAELQRGLGGELPRQRCRDCAKSTASGRLGHSGVDGWSATANGRRACLAKDIKRTWGQLADEFLQLSLVREHDNWSPFDLADGIGTSVEIQQNACQWMD